MNQGFSKEEVLTEIRGSLGHIILNRPAALNALSLEMIRQICGTLREWGKSPAVKTILFTGAGGRAFCAGGDVKAFYRAGMDYRRGKISHTVASVYFAEEYSLDRQIFHYPKPTVAFMDGIVMGGGYGIGGNCAHRIVTEKTAFAMPETGIGFFPDVGSVYHLLRAPENLGKYLALTGAQVKAADTLAAGLAEYYLPSSSRDELIAALAAGGDIKEIIGRFQGGRPEDGVFHKHAERIARWFSYGELQKILSSMAEDTAPFALETLALIESRSPTSVMVTAEHLHRSEGRGFDQVIAEDFILTQRFLQRVDFYEGIRAAVIDKDRKPRWNPAGFEGVSRDEVEAHFAPTGHNLEDIKLFVR
ncbi:MAG: enoyl-CoA hydratase/isomerase family protein [Alphaproteobacteria bacterium]